MPAFAEGSFMNESIDNSSILKVGSVAAVLLGVTRILAGGGYLLLPPELRLLSAGPNFLPAFNQNPNLLLAIFWVEAVAGILGIGVIPALTSLVKKENEGLIRWVSNLAIIGFAISTAGYLLSIVRIPVIAHAFVAGDASTKAALAVVWRSSPDLMGFWGYGTIGIWILVLCLSPDREACGWSVFHPSDVDDGGRSVLLRESILLRHRGCRLGSPLQPDPRMDSHSVGGAFFQG